MLLTSLSGFSTWLLLGLPVSGFRLKACLELLELKPTVIRGNGSEIIALSKASAERTKGVDNSHESTDAMETAKQLAQASGAIVAASGAVDIVTDGKRVVGAHNGVVMMQKITAIGCSVTTLITVFVSKGPALLRMHLIDSLYGLDEATVISRVKITKLCD